MAKYPRSYGCGEMGYGLSYTLSSGERRRTLYWASEKEHLQLLAIAVKDDYNRVQPRKRLVSVSFPRVRFCAYWSGKGRPHVITEDRPLPDYYTKVLA